MDNESLVDVSNQIFFILDKSPKQNIVEDELIDSLDILLNIIQEIISLLANGFPGQEYCIISDAVVPDSFHIDPKINYLGCHGWSFTFEIKL